MRSQAVRVYDRVAGTIMPLTVALALVMVVSLFRTYRYRRWLPPGPLGLPVLGNLHQMKQDPWIIFSQWKRQFGDLVYLNLLGRHVLVINSMKAAHELLDARAAIYSDRPRLIVASEMLTGNLFVTFAPYGDIWRRSRRAAHQGLRKGSVEKFRPVQTQKVLTLLRDLLDDPIRWEYNVQRSLASTLLAVTYGPVAKATEESVLDDIFEFTVKIVHAAFLDGHLVEYLPWLRFLPSFVVKWKGETISSSERYSNMFAELLNDSAKQVQGEGQDTLAALFLDNQEKYGLGEKQMAWLTGTLATASETISGTISWFFLEMAMNPHIQLKAQNELDEVVGRDRLPSFTDYRDLPYIRAILREVLRCHPVGPLGMQHRLIEDDVYNGHLIPKGTICVANLWAMNRDPELYGPDASCFKPERHLLHDPPIHSKEEGHVSFGFGRRICLGRHLANDSLFLICASILWMFRISPPLQADGVPVTLSDESINEGLVVHPLPYKYVMTARFESAVVILDAQMELEGGMDFAEKKA